LLGYTELSIITHFKMHDIFHYWMQQLRTFTVFLNTLKNLFWTTTCSRSHSPPQTLCTQTTKITSKLGHIVKIQNKSFQVLHSVQIFLKHAVSQITPQLNISEPWFKVSWFKIFPNWRLIFFMSLAKTQINYTQYLSISYFLILGFSCILRQNTWSLQHSVGQDCVAGTATRYRPPYHRRYGTNSQ
jgi:hypothetical protein